MKAVLDIYVMEIKMIRLLNVLLFLLFFCCAIPVFAADKETSYDRVMRTGVIRCGYVEWPPYLLKDPNTQEFSGLIYDYMMAIGKDLGFKVEWSESVGWGIFMRVLRLIVTI
jgi:ABC-type amino acid transport substrate-binding protein